MWAIESHAAVAIALGHVMDEQVSPIADHAAALITKEHGVWVFRVGEPLSAFTTEEVIGEIREGRDLSSFGAGE